MNVVATTTHPLRSAACLTLVALFEQSGCVRKMLIKCFEGCQREGLMYS
jgi:hypothetical protein